MVYEPTTNFKDSNGVDLGKKLITQDYVATVYPSLTQSAAGFIASPAELYLWGFNSFGQIGDNTTASRSTAKQVFTVSTNWKHISCGGGFTGALKTDGTLWMWGSNSYAGNIGDNTLTNRSTPRQISIAAAGGLTGWRTITAGANSSSLAIREDGTLWSWGINYFGSIGDNTRANRSTPRQISIAAAGGLTGWKQVSSGGNYCAAIRDDGTLWLWGANYANIGDNTYLGHRSTPRQISAGASGIGGWKQISCGYQHTAAIRNDGTLWTWGWNNSGQLGDNTNIRRSTPRQISAGANGITGWKQVSCGFDHTAAIRENGTLWSWGENADGQLGINQVFSKSTPVQEFTSSTNWKKVSCGEFATISTKTDGTLWVWGSTLFGRLGDNVSIPNISVPRQDFTSSITWRDISDSFSSHSAAIKFPIGQ